MDRYKITEKIGQGSQAVAYLAKRTTEPFDRVVLKRMPIEALSRTEVKMMMKLNHPNIIRCYESFEYDEHIYLVLQYADGGDLERHIAQVAKAGKKIDMNQILSWFHQLASAVQLCHRENIIHRDIKPGNVFLSKDLSTVYLGDFGVAKQFQNPTSVANTLVGSPVNLSPEVISGVPYSFKSDVWSLGCVLYEMVALRRPFNSPNFAQLVMKVCSGHYDALPPDTPEYVAKAIQGMLNIEAKDRWLISEVLRSNPAFTADTIEKKRALKRQKEDDKAAAAAMQAITGADAEDEDPDEELDPLSDWVRWKEREFFEIEAFLRGYPDYDELRANADAQAAADEDIGLWQQKGSPVAAAAQPRNRGEGFSASAPSNLIAKQQQQQQKAPPQPVPARPAQFAAKPGAPPLAPAPPQAQPSTPPDQRTPEKQEVAKDQAQRPSPAQAARAEKRAEERRQMMKDRQAALQQQQQQQQQGKDEHHSDVVVRAPEMKGPPLVPMRKQSDAQPPPPPPQQASAVPQVDNANHHGRVANIKQQASASNNVVFSNPRPSAGKSNPTPQAPARVPPPPAQAVEDSPAKPSLAEKRQGLKDMIRDKRQQQQAQQGGQQPDLEIVMPKNLQHLV